jgi:hypothetical protein
MDVQVGELFHQPLGCVKVASFACGMEIHWRNSLKMHTPIHPLFFLTFFYTIVVGIPPHSQIYVSDVFSSRKKIRKKERVFWIRKNMMEMEKKRWYFGGGLGGLGGGYFTKVQYDRRDPRPDEVRLLQKLQQHYDPKRLMSSNKLQRWGLDTIRTYVNGDEFPRGKGRAWGLSMLANTSFFSVVETAIEDVYKSSEKKIWYFTEETWPCARACCTHGVVPEPPADFLRASVAHLIFSWGLDPISRSTSPSEEEVESLMMVVWSLCNCRECFANIVTQCFCEQSYNWHHYRGYELYSRIIETSSILPAAARVLDGWGMHKLVGDVVLFFVKTHSFRFNYGVQSSAVEKMTVINAALVAACDHVGCSVVDSVADSACDLYSRDGHWWPLTGRPRHEQSGTGTLPFSSYLDVFRARQQTITHRWSPLRAAWCAAVIMSADSS